METLSCQNISTFRRCQPYYSIPSVYQVYVLYVPHGLRPNVLLGLGGLLFFRVPVFYVLDQFLLRLQKQLSMPPEARTNEIPVYYILGTMLAKFQLKTTPIETKEHT